MIDASNTWRQRLWLGTVLIVGMGLVMLGTAASRGWPPTILWVDVVVAIVFLVVNFAIVAFHLYGPALPEWTQDVSDPRFWGLLWAGYNGPLAVIEAIFAVFTGRPVIPAVIHTVVAGSAVVFQFGVMMAGLIAVVSLLQRAVAWWHGRGGITDR